MSECSCCVVEFMLRLEYHQLLDSSDDLSILGQVVITPEDHLQEVGNVA